MEVFSVILNDRYVSQKYNIYIQHIRNQLQSGGRHIWAIIPTVLFTVSRFTSRDSVQVYIPGLGYRLRWLLLPRDTQTPGDCWSLVPLWLNLTTLRICTSLVQSVVLYGSETWTMRKVDSDRIQSFHMQAPRRILGIRWYDKVYPTQ